MSDGSPFPLRPAVDGDADPRVLSLDDEAADRVLDALSSETARAIYAAVREDPATPPELVDRLDLSLQNVHYHLNNLQEAGLVESAGTGYSERGVEMTVYAPADRPLVLSTADEETKGRLRRFLGRILGGVTGLAVLSVAVQRLLGARGATGRPATNATAPPPDPGPAAGVSPGLLFFAGGSVVLLAVAAWWYVRRY